MTCEMRYRLSWPAWALALFLAGITLAATLGGSSATAPSEATAQADDRYHVPAHSPTTIAGSHRPETTDSVTVGGRSSECDPSPLPSDDFEGTELDRCRWTKIVRENPDGYSLFDGALNIVADPDGNMFGDDTTAENILLQPAPDGEWAVSTLITFDPTENFQQAGLILYGDDGNWAKFGLAYVDGRVLEYVWQEDGTPRRDPELDVTPVGGGAGSSTVLMTLGSDGTDVIASDCPTPVGLSCGTRPEYLLGRTVPIAAIPDPHVGLFAAGAGAPESVASFDFFRVLRFGGPNNPPVIEAISAQPSEGVAPLEVQFSARASDPDGDELTYSWDFGDGSSSDEQNPTHTYTYTNPGNAPTRGYEAELTVSDGTDEVSDSVTVAVDALADEDTAPPNTSVQLNGADPVPTYESPVEVTFEATDGDGSGVEVTQYRVDGGAFTDYAGPFGVAGEDGEHTIEYRSRDVAGNVEETKSVTFEFETEDGVGTCMSRSDQFNGTALDPKWELVNPHPTSQPTVGGGHLTMPIVQGDLFGGNGTAQMLLQPVPPPQYNPVPGTNSWVATAKIAHANLDVDGEMAGIAVIGRLDPNYFVRTGLIYKDDINGIWDERVLTINDEAVTLPDDDVPFPNSGLLEPEGGYIWVRLVADATTNEASTWVSTDGSEFTPFGANIPGSWDFDRSGPVRFGVFAKHDGTGDDEVRIDAFNFVLGSADPQTPGDDCGGPGDDDTTPPTTIAALDPPEPDGGGGWYISPVTVTLDASDDEGGSGVAYTEYRVDSSDPGDWERADNTAGADPFVTSFTVSEPGAHEVEYRSVDQAGNVESTREIRIEIEIEIVDPAPELSVSVKPRRKVVGPRKRRVRFRFHATYAPGPFGGDELELCARAPRRVKVIGKRCRSASGVFRKRTVSRAFKVRPKRAARGRRTRVRFIAKESGLGIKRTAVAKLRVRR